MSIEDELEALRRGDIPTLSAEAKRIWDDLLEMRYTPVSAEMYNCMECGAVVTGRYPHSTGNMRHHILWHRRLRRSM